MTIDQQLTHIYLNRYNDYITLEKQGVPREDIIKQLEHYQDEIDNLLGVDKKKDVTNRGVHKIFRLLGLWGDCRKPACGIIIGNETEILENGVTLKRWTGPTINKKGKYQRLMIKAIGYDWYDEEGFYNAVLDNADEDDINWFKRVLNDQI